MDGLTIATVGVAFLFGGIVKGVLGLGLPLVSIAVMSTVLDLRVAIPFLVIPVVLTNGWQALSGGRFFALVGRYWLMLVAGAIGVWLGTIALFRFDPSFALVLLGAMVCGYTLIDRLAVRVTASERSVPVLSPAVGMVSGVLAALTGSIGLPTAIYFQALGMAKDVFVQALGIQFMVIGAIWTAALADHGSMTPDTLTVGTLALVPAFAGMAIGQWLRGRLSQERFRVGLSLFLFLIGLNLIRKGLF